MFDLAIVYIPTRWERIWGASPLVKGGWLLLLIAAILIIVAILRSAERRGPSRVLFLVALVVAGAAYLMLDFGYISLTLRMHDPEAFRQCCRRLLERGRAGELPLHQPIDAAELPDALRRLHPSSVIIRPDSVEAQYPSGRYRTFHTYVYVPAESTNEDRTLRQTLYREIYASD